jgi:Ca2+-binding RTX toxin-like protein
MATFHIDRDSTVTYTIAQGGHTYIVDADVTFTVENTPIVIEATAADTQLAIEGQLYGRLNATAVVSVAANVDIAVGRYGIASGYSGIHLGGTGTELRNSGFIHGTDNAGVSVTSQVCSITNTGQISGLQFGILLGQSTERQAYTLDNDGLVQGDVAISTSAANGDIVLGEHSRVVGNSVAIQAFTQLGGTTDVTNHGFISTNKSLAYMGWTGVDTFTNYGFVKGNIQLEGGNDIFVDRGGRVTGVVLGGLGDDTFVVASKKTIAVELDNQGNDTVRSSVTYDLNGHGAIETLILTGRSAINGYGDERANTLAGNTGSNKLDGGAGQDRLAGGLGTDIFIFSSDGVTDTVTDFTNNQDRLWIRDFAGYDSFDDLAITQSGSAVHIALVQAGMTELIVLEGARLRQIDAGDFIFN